LVRALPNWTPKDDEIIDCMAEASRSDMDEGNRVRPWMGRFLFDKYKQAHNLEPKAGFGQGVENLFKMYKPLGDKHYLGIKEAYRVWGHCTKEKAQGWLKSQGYYERTPEELASGRAAAKRRRAYDDPMSDLYRPEFPNLPTQGLEETRKPRRTGRRRKKS